MIRRLILIAVCIACPFSAFAGPKEEAQAVFNKFLAEFTAANFEGVVGLFASDALVWGTGMRDLATTPEAVRKYFSGLSKAVPNQTKAFAAGPDSTLVLSDSVVLVSGMWQLERVVEGKPPVMPQLRISIAVVKRGDRWVIAQFHNSPRPNQPNPQ